MPRSRTKSPISLFSFQDIIMSVVGVVVLVTLILLLKLVTQMAAALPTTTITVDDLRQQIASLQPVLIELQDSVADLHRVREKSEVYTPSPDQIDALQSTVDNLESDIAAAEKRIDEAKNRIAALQNNPAIKQLEETQQEIKKLTEQLADLQQQTQNVTEDVAELQAKLRDLKTKSAALDKQLAERAALQLKVTVPKDSDKTAFILIYGQGTINVIPTDGSPKQTFSSRTQFSNWVSRRDYTKEHFVVYVRPSRFGQQDDIVKDLRARGFDVGLQVIGEKTDLSLNN